MQEEKKCSYEEGYNHKRKEQILLIFPHKIYLLNLFSLSLYSVVFVDISILQEVSNKCEMQKLRH